MKCELEEHPYGQSCVIEKINVEDHDENTNTDNIIHVVVNQDFESDELKGEDDIKVESDSIIDNGWNFEINGSAETILKHRPDLSTSVAYNPDIIIKNESDVENSIQVNSKLTIKREIGPEKSVIDSSEFVIKNEIDIEERSSTVFNNEIHSTNSTNLENVFEKEHSIENSEIVIKYEPDPENKEYRNALNVDVDVKKDGNEVNTVKIEDQADSARNYPGFEYFNETDKDETMKADSDIDKQIAEDTNEIEEEKSHTCDCCHKSFAKRSYLLKHQNIHLGKSPYACPFCFKVFSVRSNRNVHMLIHTGEITGGDSSSKNKLANEQEQKSGYADLAYEKHVRKVTLIYTSKKERDFRDPSVCLFCQKAFASNMYLHYQYEHSEEQMVKNIIGLIQESLHRRRGSSVLDNFGNFRHNTSVIRRGRGEIVVAHRPYGIEMMDYAPSDFLPCEFCLGFYLKDNLWVHEIKCFAKPIDKQPTDDCYRTARAILSPFWTTDAEQNDLLNSLFMERQDITPINFDQDNKVTAVPRAEKSSSKAFGKKRKRKSAVEDVGFKAVGKKRKRKSAVEDVGFKAVGKKRKRKSAVEDVGFKAVGKKRKRKSAVEDVGFKAVGKKRKRKSAVEDVGFKAVGKKRKRKSAVEDVGFEAFGKKRKRKSGERPHKCEVCSRTFRQAGQLKGHMRIHRGEKPYECPTCLKTFRNSSALTTHLRIHTGEKPYTCNICARSFTTSTSLKTHQVTHTGKKLYNCPQCGREFNRRNNLNVHIKRHDKNRRFTCPVCYNGFVMRAHLQRHAQLCHNVVLAEEDCKLMSVFQDTSNSTEGFDHITDMQKNELKHESEMNEVEMHG